MKGDNIMAKQKTVVNLNSEPLRDAPMTGDLIISYNSVDRYATSETQQIELETEKTICWHNIELDYVKPEPAPMTIPVYHSIDNTLVLIGNASGVPGALIVMSAIPPERANIASIMWSNGGNVPWNARVTEGETVITGYMPAAFPEGATSIVITYVIK